MMLPAWPIFRRFQAVELIALLGALFVAGCRKEDMAQQPRSEPHSPSAFFEDGNSARPLVEGTVSRTAGQSDGYEFYRTAQSTTAPSGDRSALTESDFPADFPRSGEPLRRQIERGQERYNIYCAVCHGQTGAGDGMIVQRGFIRPPSFYPLAPDKEASPDLFVRSQNLLRVKPGYIVDKITNGYGAMYSYAARVPPSDRWAIAAYIQVLQLSQAAPVSELSPVDREALNTTTTGGAP